MSALRRDFLPAELRREMDAAAIDACVAVQARQTLEETRWLLDLADAHSFIAGVIGWVDLQADDAADSWSSSRIARNSLVSGTSCRGSPTIDSCCGRRSAAAFRFSKISISPTTSSSTRRHLPHRDRARVPISGASASCSTILRNLHSIGRNTANGSAECVSLRSLRTGVLQTVRPGDRGGLETWTAADIGRIWTWRSIASALTGSSPVGLACVHCGRRLCTSDRPSSTTTERQAAGRA